MTRIILSFSLLIALFSNNLLLGQPQYLNSFDGIKIAYTIEGEGSPILLIHGFINDGTMWNKSALKKDLLAKGYQVIVPDLRGNGKSDKPQEDNGYLGNAEVQDLKLLMDKLKIESYDAVGYSRGSIVLAELLTQDSRIQNAVLGGMGVDFTNPNWNRRLLFAAAFDGKTTEETQGAVDYAKSIGADLRALHLQQKHQPSTSLEKLNLIKAKVLVIAGDEDLDNGNPKALKNAIPDSMLKIVEGDYNNTYKTQLFSKAIIDFLADL